MKHFKAKGIDWYIKEDALIQILNTFEPKNTDRRDYRIIEINKDKTYFLKFFREKGISGFLRRKINPRGKREFVMGKRLLSLSIRTPEPIGYGISKEGSFVIQRYLSGKSFLDTFYESIDRTSHIKDLATLLREMKASNIRHNDLHLNNIIVKDKNLYLIDLHKMRIKRQFSVSDEVSNISHSLAMIYRDLSEDERETFFSSYGNLKIRNQPSLICG